MSQICCKLTTKTSERRQTMDVSKCRPGLIWKRPVFVKTTLQKTLEHTLKVSEVSNSIQNRILARSANAKPKGILLQNTFPLYLPRF